MFSGLKLQLSDEEGDDDFLGERNKASSSSNLSNIFGISLEGQKKSLKQPSLAKQKRNTENVSKPEDSKASASASNWEVNIAKVVTAYKLVNQENVLQGKIGLALLKNPDQLQQIILYRTKNNILSKVNISNQTKFFVKHSYLQFTDDVQTFWSVLFEKNEIEEVLSEIKNKAEIQYYEEASVENKISVSSDKLNSETSLPVLQQICSTETNVIIEEYSSDERNKSSKASLLTRMAKVGQPLPKIAASTTTDISDSSDAETKRIHVNKPVILRKPKTQSMVPMNAISPQSLPPLIGPIYPYNAHVGIAQDSQFMQVLLSDNRTQNTEVRMNISKLETKLDRVLDKIDLINGTQHNKKENNQEDIILDLEEKLLELKKENRTLKLQIRNLDEINLKQVEKQLEKQSITAEELTKYNSLIELFNLKPSELETSEELYTEIITNLELHSIKLKSNIKSLEESLENIKKAKENIQDESQKMIDSITDENKILNSKIKELESLVDGARNDNVKILNELEVLRKQPKVDGMVKDIMNNLYERLTLNFDVQENFSKAHIMRICARAIKEETNNVIKGKTDVEN